MNGGVSTAGHAFAWQLLGDTGLAGDALPDAPA